MQLEGLEGVVAALATVRPLEAAVGTGWRLTDLIDVRTLQSIQDTFARAFGLPTVIVHPDGSNATDITHRVTFCEDLTRISRVGGPRCAECDLRAMRKAQRTGEPSIFKCWNGLYDCAIPICCKGHTLGYFLCGQVLMDAPDADAYRATARAIDVSPQAYVEALGDVRRVDFARYEASVQSMHVLAEMIAEQAAAAIDNLAILEDAERARADASRLLGELDAILEGLRDVGSQPNFQATLEVVADSLARLIPWDSCVIYLIDSARRELIPAVVRDPYPDPVRRFRPGLGQSVVGEVAVTGVGRCVSDVTREAGFAPIPGVPVEPEAMLAVPMVYEDAVSGVVVLSRFEQRTFTDHEFRVLGAFCSQASVSIQLAKLASDNAQRLREERVLSGLLRTISSGASVDGILREAAHTAVELLDADAVVLRAKVPGASLGQVVNAGIAEDGARTVLEELEDEAERARGHDAPGIAAWRGRSALVLPIGKGRDAGGVAILLGRAGRTWDERLAGALASQLTLGLDNARLHEREHRQLQEYRQLSELGAELAHASDIQQLESRLLAGARGVFSAHVVWLATLTEGPDAIEVVMLEGQRVKRFSIGLEGAGRVAALRLRDEPGCTRSVFDTWARDVYVAVAERTELGVFVAEPLAVSTGALGGLFVGWRHREGAMAPEQARMLGVVASGAGASLARLAAYQETDASLRERISDLEGLTQLAQRLTGLREEGPIIDEILSAFRRLGKLEGALYAVQGRTGLRARRKAGLSGEQTAELLTVCEHVDQFEEARRVALSTPGREAIFLPAAPAGSRGTCFAGIGALERDAQRDRALQMIARYGSVALENADLHNRQRLAIAGLEQKNEEAAEQTTKLERVLSVHETLTTAVLNGEGLGSVALSLGGFVNGELTIVAAEGRILANWPAEAVIDWRPATEKAAVETVVECAEDGAHLLAAPVVVEGDRLAWVLARLPAAADDVDRAAIEYGALVTALELLRERTATEIETRLRGGLLEDLFGGGFVEELMSKQALAFGLDLGQTNRVFLIEGTPRAKGAVQAPVDPKRLLATVAEVSRRMTAGGVTALRGTAVAAVVPEAGQDGNGTGRFEERLHRVLGERFPDLDCAIGVGTPCTVPGDYRQSFLAARRGLDLLRLQGRHNDIFSFRQATVATVLLRSTEPKVILEFISRYVDPLDQYDAKHNSELRHTAETYFEAGGKLEETARRLHVHVSTLRYRLGRIGELTGVDIKDRRAMLDLQVALEAAYPLAAHRG